MQGTSLYMSYDMDRNWICHISVCLVVLAYVHISRELRRKLEEKASKVAFVGYPPGIKGWKFLSNFKANACESWYVFLEDQIMETDDQHESVRGQISCVGYDCVAHGKDSNEEEESEFVEVAPNTEPYFEVPLVADDITAIVDHVNLPIQLTYEETFMQTLPMPGINRQVKLVGKITYYLPAGRIDPTTIEEAWYSRDPKAKSYKQGIAVAGKHENVGQLNLLQM